MITVQIALTEAEDRTLAELTAQTGKTRHDLLREAVGQYLARFGLPDRLRLLRQGCGLWNDRNDLPPLEAIRGEMDRF
jgi:hypothetical protein